MSESHAQVPFDQLDLDAYRGRNRVLLVFAPSSADDVFGRQQRDIDNYLAACHERDLVSIRLFDAEIGFAGDLPLTQTVTMQMRKRFDVLPGAFALFLIGKDGNVKLRADQQTPMSEILKLIDSMPLRQEEMQRPGGAGRT